jgi:hypothetical protein
MFQIAGTAHRDQEIVCPEDGRVYLGHDASFIGCTLRFRTRSKSGVILAKARFEACTIVADKPLRGVHWTSCTVEGCSFHGRFEDNVFGDWPEYTARLNMSGGLARCDFRGAVLHQCEFHTTAMDEIALPAWPCFTIVRPKESFARLAGMAASDWVRHWNAIDGEMARLADPSLSAMAYHAPSLIKRLARDVDVTDGALRELLASLPDVVL